jgi:hypothetical protein
MKRIATFLLYVSLGSAPLWAMPTQITFQGTLKQKGVPVNTTKNMQFSFVDASGASIPATTPISVANVQVTNGLFAVQLPIDPTIPWEQYSPFIQVSVEGQILSPNQPLNANLYAVAAIPQGMISLFATNCPVGWARFTVLDSAFPMGGAVYGATGGSATHTHGISTDGAHNHGGATGGSTVNDNNQWLFGDPQGSGSHANNFADAAHKHGISTDGAHNHGGATGVASSLPPYVTMVYCQKL